MENGSVCCFLQRTRSSSSSRRISPTVSWCCPITRSLLTNVPISIIPTMRADFPGNDPDINVEWPIPEGMELTISEKDQHWGSFKEYQEKNK